MYVEAGGVVLLCICGVTPACRTVHSSGFISGLRLPTRLSVLSRSSRWTKRVRRTFSVIPHHKLLRLFCDAA